MFFVYENWRADGHYAKVHKASCAHCNHGAGKHGVSNEENGKWHGPFANFKEADTAAKLKAPHVHYCLHCKPEKPDRT